MAGYIISMPKGILHITEAYSEECMAYLKACCFFDFTFIPAIWMAGYIIVMPKGILRYTNTATYVFIAATHPIGMEYCSQGFYPWE